MIDTEAQDLLDTEPLLRDDGNDTVVAFISCELDVSKTFAKRAWSLCATGHLAAAKLQGMAATAAYETAKQYLPNLRIPEKEREFLNVKLGILTPLIERLATIT
jgi:hypothetical protein